MFDTVKRSKFFMFFVVVALLSAVVFTGGCNESSSDSGLKLAYDQDNDGVLDIFDDYPNDASNDLYPEISGFETLVGVDGENKAVALPCHYNGTFETSKDVSGETAKFFLFKAEKGKRVAVVFSSPNCRLEDAFLSFVPDVDIYPYEAVEPFEDDRPDADETESGDKQEAKGTDEKDNSVKYEVNRYASGAFTSLSFVPEKSGIYVMKLRKVNAGWEPGSDDVQCDVDFSIFLDADGNGLDDVWNDKYDIEDFADVLAVIQPFIISADKGLPVLKDHIVMWKYVAASADASGDVSEPISGKTEEIQYLKDVVSEDIAALNDAKLTSGNGLMTMELYDVPFVYGFGDDKLGYGMNAILGPRPATGERQVADVTNPDLSKYTGGFKARTIMEFVDSDANLKKEVSVAASVGASGSIGKTPMKFCDKHDWANTSSFSEHTTTLIIKYERLSNQYLDGTNVKLTDEAKQALNSDGSAGKVAFRKKFGDYYLVGYQKGAQCVVTITIKANSKEEINTVRNALNASIGPVELNAEFKNKLTTALRNTKISFKYNLVGGPSMSLPEKRDITGDKGDVITETIKNVNDYIKGVNLSNMAVINCHFKHISFLTDKFPDSYPAPASKRYFEKETELYNLLWSIQVRRNVIDSFDTDIFTGKKDPYQNKADAFRNKITGINDEAEMIRNIDKNIEEGKAVLADLQTIGDRYYFYRKLIDIRKNWWYKNGFGDYGFKNYPESPYVHKELQDNTGGYVWNSHYKDKWKFLSYWYVYYPGKPYTLSEDYRSVYFHLERVDQYTSITDYAWENNHGPSFGSRYLSHYWKGGVMRGIEWKMQIRALHMPYERYPFKGLDEARPLGNYKDRVKPL